VPHSLIQKGGLAAKKSIQIKWLLLKQREEKCSLDRLSLLPHIYSLSKSNPSRRQQQQGPRGDVNKNQQTFKSPFISSSGRPLNSSSTRDDLLGGPSSTTRSRRKSKNRPPTAPLVDSALLRFLAQQQKEKEKNKSENKEEKQDDGNNMTPSLSANVDRIQSAPQNSAYKNTNDVSSTSIDGSPSDASWLGQFNSNRVAVKLMSLGVDEGTALETGEIVQQHVLARTARRRVRQFLKERDAMWRSTTSSSGGGSSGEPITEQQKETLKEDEEEEEENLPSIPSYGLDDVVDLLLEFGLTGNDMAAIFSHTPSLTLMLPRRIQQQQKGGDDTESSGGETLEETTQRAFTGLLCKTLKLRRYDARKVLRNCPGLLTMRGSRSSLQVVKLMTKLGVSTGSIARDKPALPKLLSRSPAGIFRLVSFLASDAVRMPTSKIGPLLRRKECAELLDAVVPVPRMGDNKVVSAATTTIRQNETPTAANTDADEIASFIWGKSSELRREQINSVYRDMSKTAWTLRHKIGTEDLGKVIAAYPSVLLLDASENILPTASYMMNELGLWEDDLPSVLQLYPALFGMGRSQMEQVTSYLLSLEVEREALASIFRAFPSLLALDVEKDMKPVVSFLREIGVANIGRFVTRLPPILGYSIDDELIPKWEYLKEVCLYNIFELSRFPAYFSYPLDRVIKTRYEYLRIVKRIPTQLLPLDGILRYGDKDFATLVAGDTDAGETYAKFAKQKRTTKAGGTTAKLQQQRKNNRRKQRKSLPTAATVKKRRSNKTNKNRTNDDSNR